MTTTSGHRQRRLLLSLLMLLTLIGAFLAPAVDASASTRPVVETRVRANDHPTAALVGRVDPASPTTIGGSGVRLRQLVSATGVATNSGGLADDAAGLVCHSFDRRTEVLMADGTRKRISDVKVGDRVRTTDPKTGETVVRPVTELHVNRDTDLADLTVLNADGHESTIHTTQHHKFWSDTDGDWVEAEDLTPGERLHNPDGDVVTVAGVVSFGGLQTMYDLTIEGVHTYYVEAGDSVVLVHNCGELPLLDGTGKVHGELPSRVLDNWTTDDLTQLADDLQTSIATRKSVNAQLGLDYGHVRRLADEEALLVQVLKRLSGS